jgi:GAF domain-containing protein
MNKHELMARQQALRLRSAQLRLNLREQTQVFKRPLALADSAQSALQWLYRHPALPIGAAALLLVLRPKQALVWADRAWQVWKSFQRVQDWLARP